MSGGSGAYVPAGPVEQPPGGFWPVADRRAAFELVLRGVELGDHDRRVVEWVLQWDDSTIRTIASLFERVRAAGGAR